MLWKPRSRDILGTVYLVVNKSVRPELRPGKFLPDTQATRWKTPDFSLCSLAHYDRMFHVEHPRIPDLDPLRIVPRGTKYPYDMLRLPKTMMRCSEPLSGISCAHWNDGPAAIMT
jgi:hypothetical protein